MSLKIQSINKSSPSDIEYLKTVSRKMLLRLEEALDMEHTVCEDNAAWRQQAHERVFGVKSSLASTLVMLAELMLKLEQADSAAEMQHVPVAAMSASDITLVEAFIDKIKSPVADASPPKGEQFSL